MDSLTQATLGAAVAEAGLGRSLGRKAMLWGLLLGTFPDLDILAYPLLDVTGQLYWHRGLSHSIMAMVVISPLLGLILHKIHGAKAPPIRAIWTCFWIYATHVLIDCFTVYGTQIFEPFSDYRFGLNNLFIIDPLFTLPLIAGLVGAFFLRKRPQWRNRANWIGIGLCTLYVVWSFGAKAIISHRVTSELSRQGIEVQRGFTHPSPFNTILWRSLHESEDGYWIGYASLLDETREIEFRFVPRKGNLLDPLRETRAARGALWFSEGYYLTRIKEGGVTLSDLRFGEFEQADGEITTFFTWQLVSENGQVSLKPLRSQRPEGALEKIWDRMLGKRESETTRATTN